MIKKKLLTAAVLAMLTMSMTGCSGIVGHSLSSLGDSKNLFDHSLVERDDEEDEKDSEEDEEDKTEEDSDNDSSDKDDDKEDEDEKDTEDEDKEESNSVLTGLSEKEIKEELGDNIKSGKFAIEDTVYSLPAKVEDFEKNGWEVDEENSDEYIDQERSGHIVMKNGRSYIYLYVENFDSYTIKATDATVNAVDVDYDFNTKFYLPADLNNEMSNDDIKDALDKNDVNYDYDDSYSYPEYQIASNDYQISITIDPDEGSVYRMQIYAIIRDSSDYEGAPKAEVETLDSSDVDIDYTKPEKLSDRADFELDGDLYTMGAPVSEFLDNGWELEEDNVVTDMQISAGDTGSALLVKGDERIQFHLVNEADGTVAVKDAVVDVITAMDSDFELLGDIKTGESIDDVKDYLDSENIKYDEYSSILSFKDDGVYVTVYKGDNDKVEGFELDLN